MHIREQNRYILFKEFTSGIGGPDAGDSNGTGECERRENPLGAARPAAGADKHPPSPPRALPAIPPPRDEGAGAATGVRAVVPEGTHPPGDESEPGGADPGGASGGLSPARSADPAVPGEAPRGVSQDARSDLLQTGGPVARRLAQAEHGVRASVLRGPGGGRGPGDRDRRGSMGIRPRPRRELLRPEGKVFMVRVSYDQKPYRKYVMNLYGADVIPSPSDQTNIGKKFLAQDPDHPGSLGIAISEAIESAVTGKNTRYSLGSVLNHVLMHQTIIGLETQKQFELAEITPDFMVGSVGGGSNFGGFTYPMIGERIHGNVETRFVAVEPESVPSMTQGRYEYDFGDTGEITPLVKMHTLGHSFVPPRIHAGGLRYHGTAATLSVLLDSGLVEPRAVDQVSTFQAGEIFAKTEGSIPAPETCHAIRGAIDLALEAKARNEATTIAFNYSGHGLLDLEGYRQFMEGTLKNNGK